MAEAFGVAAGGLTVLELTIKVIKQCKTLIETAHDAPRVCTDSYTRLPLYLLGRFIAQREEMAHSPKPDGSSLPSGIL